MNKICFSVAWIKVGSAFFSSDVLSEDKLICDVLSRDVLSCDALSQVSFQSLKFRISRWFTADEPLYYRLRTIEISRLDFTTCVHRTATKRTVNSWDSWDHPRERPCLFGSVYDPQTMVAGQFVRQAHKLCDITLMNLKLICSSWFSWQIIS